MAARYWEGEGLATKAHGRVPGTMEGSGADCIPVNKHPDCDNALSKGNMVLSVNPHVVMHYLQIKSLIRRPSDHTIHQ